MTNCTYLHHFIYDTFKLFWMQQECWTIDSLDTYKPTWRMAAIYNANCQDQKKSMKIFCRETGYTQKKAEEYLAEAIGLRARQTEVSNDRDEDDTAVIEAALKKLEEHEEEPRSVRERLRNHQQEQTALRKKGKDQNR